MNAKTHVVQLPTWAWLPIIGHQFAINCRLFQNIDALRMFGLEGQSQLLPGLDSGMPNIT